MQSRLTNRRVLLTLLGIVLSFAFLYFTFAASPLIIYVNGVLVGAMVAIGVTWHKLLIDSWVNPNDYGRVRQMTLTIIGLWVVVGLGVSTSIYIKTADLPTTAFASISFSRYLAIWLAIFQVTAPDYGRGPFYGTDRKFLGLGIVTGLAVSALTIWLQATT